MTNRSSGALKILNVHMLSTIPLCQEDQRITLMIISEVFFFKKTTFYMMGQHFLRHKQSKRYDKYLYVLNVIKRCGYGPFRVSSMRQLEKQCGNAAGRVPRKNPI